MFAYSEEQLQSLAKVEETRAERTGKDLRRMSAEEKDALLAAFHPDYIRSAYTNLQVGANAGAPVLKELAALLEGTPRILSEKVDLSKIKYDVDVLVIGGGGAGASAAVEAKRAGANVMMVTKLRIGDANTAMAEGGIQAADREGDSPAIHYLDALGGGHFKNKQELLEKLVTEAPEAILWLNTLGVMFDKDKNGDMVETHGGGTSRKRMHACRDYSGSEIMRVLRDEVFNLGIPVVDFTSAIELIKDKDGKAAGAVLQNMETGFQSLRRNGGRLDFSLPCGRKTAVSRNASISPYGRGCAHADLRRVGHRKGAFARRAACGEGRHGVREPVGNARRYGFFDYPRVQRAQKRLENHGWRGRVARYADDRYYSRRWND